MDFIFYDTAFGHKPKEFCKRMVSDHHFISFFYTDFLYEKDGKMLIGHAGDVLILPSGNVVYHGPTAYMEEGFINDWMYVSGDDFLEEAKSLDIPIGVPFSVGGRCSLALCIEKIRTESSMMKLSHSKMCELYMRECMIDIARAYESKTQSDAKELFDALRAEMIRAPKNDWTLSSMATYCGYSESRFSAIYRDFYSISPIADLIKIRIENAKSLLSYSNMQISEISEAVGFSSLYYFSRYFKKSTGISPSDYRKA